MPYIRVMKLKIMSLLQNESVWYNELGSKMILNIDEDGGLSGTYNSAVGDVENNYTLVGRYDAKQSPPTIGWIVQWVNPYKSVNAVTAWSGQIIISKGIPTIHATWILTSQTKPENEWESTLIDQDVFTPMRPTDEKIKESLKRRAKSHHPHIHK